MNNVLGVFRVINEEKLFFWLFVGVNLFFGAMALWLPPVIATLHPIASPLVELLKAFDQGNGYLFGLALLAAAVSFWMRQYIDNNDSEFKTLKLASTSFSFLIMFLMAIFLTATIYSGFSSEIDDSKVAYSCIHWGALITQILFTIFAAITATYLFCLERLDKFPEYGIALKDKTERKIQNGMKIQSKKTNYKS